MLIKISILFKNFYINTKTVNIYILQYDIRIMQKPQIKTEIPGKIAKKIIAEDTKYLAIATKTSPIAIKKARGIILEDVDGNIFYDFTSGVGVLNVGHCHPKVVNAIKQQAELFSHFAGTDFYYDVQGKLAKKLTEITPGNFPKKVFFTNSGAESNECAIKVCRSSTNRKQFIAFMNCFHGRTMGALSLTASKIVQREKYFPMMHGVVHLPYAYCYRCRYKLTYPECDLWCAKILDEVYFQTILPSDEVAGMFIESVQGEGGYIVPPSAFVREMRKITQTHGILLIDDEVQSGFGRTGKFFAIEHHGVVPDVISLAKALGGGLPMGASIFNAKYDFDKEGRHSNTFGGNGICCSAGLKTIEVIEKEKLVENSEKVGKYFKKLLYELQEKYECIGDVRGLGLMLATEIVKDKKTKKIDSQRRDKIIERSYKNGLILLPCGVNVIRYIPPLIVREEEIDVAYEIIDKSIKESL